MGFVKEKKRIGDMLIDAGKITPEDLQKALDEQKRSGTKLGNALVDMGFVTDNDIVQTLCQQLRLESVNLQAVAISRDVLSRCQDVFC